MKILVPIARTEDYNARIVVNKAGDDIERGGVAMVINLFDEIAVEEALRLLDGGEGEIIVVAIGGDEAAPELRRALAGRASGDPDQHRGQADARGRDATARSGR